MKVVRVAIRFAILVRATSVAQNVFDHTSKGSGTAVSSEAKASDCRKGSKGKEKCKFHSGDLKFDNGASIRITVKQGGSLITCNHSNKGKTNRWCVPAIGDFFPTTVLCKFPISRHRYMQILTPKDGFCHGVGTENAMEMPKMQTLSSAKTRRAK